MQVLTGTAQRVEVLTKVSRHPAMSDAGPNRNYTESGGTYEGVQTSRHL